MISTSEVVLSSSGPGNIASCCAITILPLKESYQSDNVAPESQLVSSQVQIYYLYLTILKQHASTTCVLGPLTSTIPTSTSKMVDRKTKSKPYGTGLRIALYLGWVRSQVSLMLDNCHRRFFGLTALLVKGHNKWSLCKLSLR